MGSYVSGAKRRMGSEGGEVLVEIGREVKEKRATE